MASMASSEPAADRLTLDQLIALNNEITALGKAGMPLEPGLRRAASRGGAGGRLAGKLAKAMQAGATLEQAVQAQGDQLPELYRAVVRSGAQAGNLTAGLEQFSEIATRQSDMRRSIVLSLVYPSVVLLIAWSLTQFTTTRLLPEYAWIGVGQTEPTYFAQFVRGIGLMLQVVIPVALVCGLIAWWRSASAAGRGVFARRLPLLGASRYLSAQACFADLLRLLLDQRTPLPEALELAANATGWRPLQERCQKVAQQITRGNSDAKALSGLPPLVAMALKFPVDQPRQSELLAGVAAAYRRQAEDCVLRTRLLLPATATGAIGGLAVLAYGLYALGPYFQSLNILAAP